VIQISQPDSDESYLLHFSNKLRAVPRSCGSNGKQGRIYGNLKAASNFLQRFATSRQMGSIVQNEAPLAVDKFDTPIAGGLLFGGGELVSNYRDRHASLAVPKRHHPGLLTVQSTTLPSTNALHRQSMSTLYRRERRRSGVDLRICDV